MNAKEKISIVVASDNHYAVLIAALIKSIEVNHKSDELISFTIIDDGISNKNKEKLKKSIDPKITTLHWKKSSDVIPPEINIPVDQTTLPITTYLRLFAPYAAGLDCEKVIYMDVDMILYEDISKLYHTDIGNNTLGAVQDYMETFAPRGIPNYKELDIPPKTKYFNAGLLLINSKKWLEADVANRVINCMNDNKQHVLYADQYGLNIILRNQWYELDRVWNRSDSFDYLPNPSLVHFLDIKPIFKSCFALQKNKDEFFRLLSLTAYKNFKPKSDYQRLFKKGFTKAKKIVQNKLIKIFGT